MMVMEKIDEIIINGQDEYCRPTAIVVKGQNMQVGMQQSEVHFNGGQRINDFRIRANSRMDICIDAPFTVEVVARKDYTFDDVESL